MQTKVTGALAALATTVVVCAAGPALQETGNDGRVAEVLDFPLALELGLAAKSGWSFMELGRSRIAASALEPNFPNSNLSVQGARSWLAAVDVRDLGLSPVVVGEELNLVQLTA